MERSQTVFFASANTEDGFVSLFGEVFPPEKLGCIYILKGGPGTGKSTLLRHVGAVAEEHGVSPVYINCSSDTDSCDGILLPSLGTAVLDGTAPHIIDPRYPGAVERIINLSEALDFKTLAGHRREIIELSRRKDNAYRTAYRYLYAAGRLARQMTESAETAFLAAKADAAVGRLLASFKNTVKGEKKTRYISAYGIHGRVHLDTLRNTATRTLALTDRFGLGYMLLSRIRAVFIREGLAFTECPTPLMPTRPEALYLEGEQLYLYVTTDEEAACCDKTLNISRFVNRDTLAELRGRLRFSEKCVQALENGALDALSHAGRHHRELEKIYAGATDFSCVDRMREGLIREIFANKV